MIELFVSSASVGVIKPKLSKLNNFAIFLSVGFLSYDRKLSCQSLQGWSGGAMVLGKLPVPGRPAIWITVGPGPTALAEGAGGGCLDIFILIYPFSPLSPSLWETA